MRRGLPAALTLSGALVLGGAAWAQATQPAAIDPAGAARGSPQISSAASGGAVSQISRARTIAETAAQIAAPPASAASGQLNLERGLAPAAQLNRSGRTAQGSAPLSTPAQGVPRASAPIGGSDRCDPRVPAARRTPECARVLEARSDEFQRPEPTPLTPEQRLLAERREPTEESVDARTVARRAASGAVGDDLAGQALAASANAANNNRRREEENNNPGNAETDAIGSALLDLIGVTGGPGVVVTPPPPR